MTADRVEPLDEYTTVVRGGMAPASPGAGRLSRERAEKLDADLLALRIARSRALVESMTYLVVSR